MEPVGTQWDLMPSVDVIDEDKQLRVQAELPGFNKDQIRVQSIGNSLVLSGESKDEREYGDTDWTGRWRVKERKFGKFERRLPMGEDVDLNKVSAKFENGLLDVVVPKSEQALSSKKTIEIE